MSMDDKLLLTVEEVQELTGIGRTTLYELIKSGTLPSITIGRARRIPRKRLDEYIASLNPIP